jgi:hypothetical protein
LGEACSEWRDRRSENLKSGPDGNTIAISTIKLINEFSGIFFNLECQQKGNQCRFSWVKLHLSSGDVCPSWRWETIFQRISELGVKNWNFQDQYKEIKR